MIVYTLIEMFVTTVSSPKPKIKSYSYTSRFNTHCKFHRMDDERELKRRQNLARVKEFRGCIEDTFIQRLRTARVLKPRGPGLEEDEEENTTSQCLVEDASSHTDMEDGDAEIDTDGQDVAGYSQDLCSSDNSVEVY